MEIDKGKVIWGPTTESTVSNQPHILVADDDEEMRRLLVMSLQSEGYRVSECSDGKKLLKEIAVSWMLKKYKYKKIGLIISDVRMPGFSGFEVLRNIKSFDALPPIILITAFGSYEMHEQAQKLGVFAMLDKPFDFDDLLVKVHQIFPGDKSSED